MEKIQNSKIFQQALFCKELMTRLANNVGDAKKGWCGNHLENYTQMQNDIVRLRRELMTLRKMLDKEVM